MSYPSELEEKPRKKSKLKKIFKYTVPLVLGIVILYFLYKDTNFTELWGIIKHANWFILSLSLVFGLLGNIVRGLKWELLINPLGYYPKRSHLIYAVLGSYAVNFALPRAGEIWRCGIVSRGEKIPFTKLLGTLIVDRITDTVVVILIVIVVFMTSAAKFLENSDQFDIPPVLTSPMLYIGILAGIAFIIFVLVVFKNNSFVKKVREMLHGMGQDLLVVWRMKEKGRFIFYSFLIWFFYFIYFYITFYAFDFTANLGLTAGLFVFTMGSVSMAIPSNGGLGPWQAAVMIGLTAFMVGKDEATAFATAVFTFQSLWLVLCGLFGIVMYSVKTKHV